VATAKRKTSSMPSSPRSTTTKRTKSSLSQQIEGKLTASCPRCDSAGD
jgi:hypothetical protein